MSINLKDGVPRALASVGGLHRIDRSESYIEIRTGLGPEALVLSKGKEWYRVCFRQGKSCCL